jgi:hypothetical protein
MERPLIVALEERIEKARSSMSLQVYLMILFSARIGQEMGKNT